MTCRSIDFKDIQGLVRFGHGRLTEACFLLLRVNDAKQARRWLQVAPVTSAETLSPRPDEALQVAFSAAGLQVLGLDQDLIDGFSDEFIVGMADDNSRSRRLGDVAENAPGQWQWGADGLPHLVVLLYAREGRLMTFEQRIRSSGFEAAFELLSRLETRHTDQIEPFGFADGISQPAIDWEGRHNPSFHAHTHYTNQVALGEVLLGYPNEYGDYTARPLVSAERGGEMLDAAEEQPQLGDLGRNGCYLVIRQLEQDVAGFWRFADSQTSGDASLREALAASMVGRQRDGTPLVAESVQPIEENSDQGAQSSLNQSTLNQFDFDQDPHGHQCPLGAHIRRSNPRTGDYPAGVSGWFSRLVRLFGFGRRYPGDDLVASTRFHRILRRGRVYGGPPLDPSQALEDKTGEARGLHFICLVSSISRQFEFLQNAWTLGPKFAGLADESDPLLGNREPLSDGTDTSGFTRPDARGPACRAAGLPQFVRIRGGGYFFMPGLKALRFIATGGITSDADNDDGIATASQEADDVNR